MKSIIASLVIFAAVSAACGQVIDDWNTPVTADSPVLKPRSSPSVGGKPAAPAAGEPIESRRLTEAEKATMDGLLTYLGDEIKTLKKFQEKNDSPDLAKAIERLQGHMVTLNGMTYRKAGVITRTAGPDAYAAYWSLTSPQSIYLLDKFFEPSAAQPSDDPAMAKVKTQLYLAERLSLLMHELGHAGKLNYITDQPAAKDPFDSGESEVRLRKDMGTGDEDCYLAQYYLMRILMDQAMDEYDTLAKTGFNSAVLITALSQLRDLGILKVNGDITEPSGLLDAMKKADMALALKYGIRVPKTLGRKVADPPAGLMPAASPSPGVPPKTGGGTATGKKMTDAEYGAAVAAAWSEVIARGVEDRNAKSTDGTRYRLEWLAAFTYRREKDKDYIVGSYCMWQKNAGAGQKEFKAFEFGGNKDGEVGYLPLAQAVSGVSQYNQEHPTKKIPLPNRGD